MGTSSIGASATGSLYSVREAVVGSLSLFGSRDSSPSVPTCTKPSRHRGAAAVKDRGVPLPPRLYVTGCQSISLLKYPPATFRKPILPKKLQRDPRIGHQLRKPNHQKAPAKDHQKKSGCSLESASFSRIYATPQAPISSAVSRTKLAG